MAQKIAVCECGEPLVGTMIVPGAEWICVACGNTTGALECATEILNDDLELRRDQNATRFRDIAKPCIPPGSYRVGCKKCKGEYHSSHATAEEMRASNAAYAAIYQMRHNSD